MLSIRTFVTGLCLALSLAAPARAEGPAVALGGTVTSAEDGAMEGVLVSCAARSAALRSLRSAVAPRSAATSTATGPLSSKPAARIVSA